MGKKGVESMIEEIKVYIENCKPMPLSQTWWIPMALDCCRIF